MKARFKLDYFGPALKLIVVADLNKASVPDVLQLVLLLPGEQTFVETGESRICLHLVQEAMHVRTKDFTRREIRLLWTVRSAENRTSATGSFKKYNPPEKIGEGFNL